MSVNSVVVDPETHAEITGISDRMIFLQTLFSRNSRPWNGYQSNFKNPQINRTPFQLQIWKHVCMCLTWKICLCVLMNKEHPMEAWKHVLNFTHVSIPSDSTTCVYKIKHLKLVQSLSFARPLKLRAGQWQPREEDMWDQLLSGSARRLLLWKVGNPGFSSGPLLPKGRHFPYTFYLMKNKFKMQ